MVGVSGITLDYVTRRAIPAGWTAANDRGRLKCQAIYIGMAWEANKVTVCTKFKA